MHRGTTSLKFSYDAEADAAYIYLVDEITPGAAVLTAQVDPDRIDGMINLDFDSDGRLLGVEILDASRFLPPGFAGGVVDPR